MARITIKACLEALRGQDGERVSKQALRSTGWRRAAWFAGLYAMSILVFGGVLGLLELCLPK